MVHIGSSLIFEVCGGILTCILNGSSWAVGTGAADTAPRGQNRYNNTSLPLQLWMQRSREGLWLTTL